MNNLSRGIVTHSYRHVILHFLIALSLVFACPLFAKAEECSSSIGDYIAIPPFLSSGVEANLLLMLDNSGSMYDLAYVDGEEYCYDDNYSTAKVYAGYFDQNVWYKYDETDGQFEESAATACDSATGTKYSSSEVCITIDTSQDPDEVTAFAAKGNFLNWATASKLDIQKKILTGGKYDNKQLVMESRGCIGSRFVKQVAVIPRGGGNVHYLTLGVRPPEDKEKVGASDNTTRIEIFDVTDTGFNNTPCQNAIAELQKDSPNQGQIKQDIEDCMGYHSSNQELADKMNAFNHSIHNCWYASKNEGAWPPGAGPTQSVKNDCKKIYDAGVGPWEIIPGDMGYVCFGVYDDDPDTNPNPNPFGYVGRCWKLGANVTCECMKYHPQHPGDLDWCQKWECTGGEEPGWDAAGYTSVEACIEKALQDYCGDLKILEVIDPSDQASETGEFWNIPAVLIDSGVVAQQGEPIAVLKCYIEQTEPPTGIIQEFADDLRIGVMIFNNYGSKTECNETDPLHIKYNCSDPGNRDGGNVTVPIDDGAALTADGGNHTTELVSAINKIKATCWTPLAEAMYTAIGYYTQNDALMLDDGDFPIDGNNTDPVQFWCQHNNVLIITEGASTADRNQEVINFIDGQTEDDNDTDVVDCGSLDGSTYLDDLTYYAQHIYPENEQPEDKNKQNITTHIVVAGTLRSTETSDECSPDILLQNAALNGGTLLHKAENQSDLERELRKIFMEIREGAAAGSAASVISASRAGEGVIYQAIFFPKDYGLSGKEVNWSGEVHALFVDDYGQMHEDTNENDTFDLDADRIIEFDGDTGLANLYNYDSETEEKTLADANVTINDIKFIWDTTSWLSDPGMDILTQRELDVDGNWTNDDINIKRRYIFTDYIDTGASVSMDNVNDTDIMDFKPGFVAANDNYYFLNPANPEVGLTEDEMITEAQNIIRFVRGEEGLSETGTDPPTPYRNRTLDKDGDDTVYRLGDIIHSTPTVVSQPSEDYDLLYRDNSYRAFRKKYLNRRIVVYAGANDGMLHAFNGGFYDASAHKFKKQHDGETEFELGSELWAYIPNALLPHLKWLKEPLDDNTHVYYVDLKPRIFDARIFSDDLDHPGGWGTVLIGGMRFGGSPIGVDTDGDGICDLNFQSTYFALDITNPEVAPSLLWSFSDDNLGFTTSYPTPIRVGSRWFVVIGSGPDNYDATRKDDGVHLTEYGGSNSTASVYILNADDGSLAREFSMDGHSFMAAPIAVDFDLATTVDGNGDTLWTGEAIYVASDGCDDEQEGQVFRIKTDEYEDPKNWTKAVFFNPNSPSGDHQHINTALSVARDDEGRIWVYFGTGRFWSTLDRQSPYLDYQNTFYGIKEPVVDVDTDLTLTYATVGAKGSHLRNVTGIEIEDYNTLSLNTSVPLYGPAVSDKNGDNSTDFSDLEAEVRAKDGWYLNFSETGERNLGQAGILGDIVTFTTFVPNDDLCAYEGRSYLYALYYKTGTAYWKGVLKTEDNNGTGIDPDTHKVVSKIDIGKGYSETANIHTGREAGSKAFVQTSTGAIISIEQANPGIIKSGKVSWQER